MNNLDNIIKSNTSLGKTNDVEQEINLLNTERKKYSKQIKQCTITQYTLTILAVQELDRSLLGKGKIQTTKETFLDYLVTNKMPERKAKRLRTVAFSKVARQQFTAEDTSETVSKFLSENKLGSVRKIEAFFLPAKNETSKVQKMYKDFQELESNEQLEIGDLISTFIRVHNLALDVA
jgi:hypothetical protein